MREKAYRLLVCCCLSIPKAEMLNEDGIKRASE